MICGWRLRQPQERSFGSSFLQTRFRGVWFGPEAWNGIEKFARELRARGGEKLLDGTAFDNDSASHHHCARAQAAHYGQVVRNEQHRKSRFAQKPRERSQKLSLNGDVKRRERFVGEKRAWLSGQGAGDADALALAAAEFVWIARGKIRRQFNAFEEFCDACATRCARGELAAEKDEQRLLYGGADSHAAIQSAGGVLEHHLHLRAEGPHVGAG